MIFVPSPFRLEAARARLTLKGREGLRKPSPELP
jgi:hypothetical protein